MAKRKEARVQRLSRGQLSRREREERERRLILGGVGAVLALAVLVLALGFYQEKVAKPSQPIAKVRGQAISRRDYEERLRYGQFWLSLHRAELQKARLELPSSGEAAAKQAKAIGQQLEELDLEETSLPQQLVDTMIDDLLIRQAMEREGRPQPSDQEVEGRLLGLFGWGGQASPTATLPLTPTISEDEARGMLASFLRKFTSETGLSEGYLRARLGEEIARQELRQRLALGVPPVAEEVQVRHILLDSEEAATAALQRLANGEDFAKLAKELSLDTTSAERGGDLGWFPRGLMVSSFEEAAFGTAVGATSGVVPTAYGYHILQVLGREARSLDEGTLAALQESTFYQWLQAERSAADIERFALPLQPTPRSSSGRS